MAIAKRPKPIVGSEQAAERFEQAAGKAKASEILGKTPVLFRFKNDFMGRIDAAAKKHELPRQAWVRTIIAKALEAEGL